jgi:hypothetical protein
MAPIRAGSVGSGKQRAGQRLEGFECERSNGECAAESVYELATQNIATMQLVSNMVNKPLSNSRRMRVERSAFNVGSGRLNIFL